MIRESRYDLMIRPDGEPSRIRLRDRDAGHAAFRQSRTHPSGERMVFSNLLFFRCIHCSRCDQQRNLGWLVTLSVSRLQKTGHEKCDGQNPGRFPNDYQAERQSPAALRWNRYHAPAPLIRPPATFSPEKGKKGWQTLAVPESGRRTDAGTSPEKACRPLPGRGRGPRQGRVRAALPSGAKRRKLS
jgi:hypothetical protein